MLNQDIVSGSLEEKLPLSFVGDNACHNKDAKLHRLITRRYKILVISHMHMFLRTVDNHIPWKALRCRPSASAVFESTCKNMACVTNHPAHQAKREP